MSVLRNLNVLSQMRLDVPHIRLLESGVAGDFDAVVGRAWAGSKALVVKGFAVAGTGNANTLALNVADSIAFNVNASASGSFIWIPADRAPEILDGSTNGKVKGSFAASAVNYVGLDFTRQPDESTTDLVQFKDPTTGEQSSRLVPLGKTLDYQISVGIVPFSAQKNLIPLAIVVTDAVNGVITLTDARNMMYRLGSGGDAPSDRSTYSWPQGRAVSGFGGADKSLTSQKDWVDAVMTRLQELGGGISWYSPSADRNVEYTNYGTPFSNGEYFTFNSGTGAITWQGIRFLFDGGVGVAPATFNEISASSGTILDGQVLYVDLDRTTDRVAGVNGLIAQIGNLANLGTGSVPGNRWVIAWRVGTLLYTRNWRYPVGTIFTPATTTSLGVVQLNQTPDTPFTPTVVSIMAGGMAKVVSTGIGSLGAGTGSGEADDLGQAIWGQAGGLSASYAKNGIAGVGQAAQASGLVAGIGLLGVGGNTEDGTGGIGVKGVGGTDEGVNGHGGNGGYFKGGAGVNGYGHGLYAVTGGTLDSVAAISAQGTGSARAIIATTTGDNAIQATGAIVGVSGIGVNSGASGVVGTAPLTGISGLSTGGGGQGVLGLAIGPTAGVGVSGQGNLTGSGVKGTGGIGGTGVEGIGGTTGPGVTGIGGASGANGVVGTGTLAGSGVVGYSGPTGQQGVAGIGVGNANGVIGYGAGTGAGVVGSSTNDAVLSTVGHVTIANPVYKFRFGANKSGVVFVPASAFVKTVGPSTLLDTITTGSDMNQPYWMFSGMATSILIGRGNVPRGATITSIDMLWKKPSTPTLTGNISVRKMAFNTSTTDMTATVVVASAFSVGTSGIAFVGWKSISPVTPVLQVTGLGGLSTETGYVDIQLNAANNLGGNECQFGGIAIGYSYTEVDFGI